MAQFNMNDLVSAPNFDVWARPFTLTPLVSQPGQPAYGARGYYTSRPVDVITEGGGPLSDSVLELDMLIAEFAVLPMQGDRIDMSAHQGVSGGVFLITDLTPDDGKGMVTATLRKLTDPRPAPAP